MDEEGCGGGRLLVRDRIGRAGILNESSAILDREEREGLPTVEA